MTSLCRTRHLLRDDARARWAFTTIIRCDIAQHYYVCSWFDMPPMLRDARWKIMRDVLPQYARCRIVIEARLRAMTRRDDERHDAAMRDIMSVILSIRIDDADAPRWARCASAAMLWWWACRHWAAATSMSDKTVRRYAFMPPLFMPMTPQKCRRLEIRRQSTRCVITCRLRATPMPCNIYEPLDAHETQMPRDDWAAERCRCRCQETRHDAITPMFTPQHAERAMTLYVDDNMPLRWCDDDIIIRCRNMPKIYAIITPITITRCRLRYLRDDAAMSDAATYHCLRLLFVIIYAKHYAKIFVLLFVLIIYRLRRHGAKDYLRDVP